jgi:energy-coupling factor transporter ATP-binding protein EcfA2
VSTAALTLDRVSYAYPGAARPAIEAVSLVVAPGELVLVAGASGSGKSTLLRTASGLVPHFFGGSLAGEVEVVGMNTRCCGPGGLSRFVGSLFQDPETQVVMGTVRGELAFPLENRGASSAAVARGVEEAALALGIAHLLDRTTDELSGGELQRVALGAALAGRPSLLVLDEPTSQLDPVAGDELISSLRRANEDSDTAVLLAEHRLERCLSAADRVLAMVGGRLAFDGEPTAFLEWAATAAPELQTPGARLLGGLELAPAPSVKRARAALRARGLLDDGAEAEVGDGTDPARPRRWARPGRRRAGTVPALEFRGVWHELRAGAAILRGVSLRLEPGEKVALMGRNGAGKSTLLRHAAGLTAPTRGNVESQGRVALLLQNPTDYLVHETVEREAGGRARARVGLADAELAQRNPRDLSGGERQRLALAIVLGDGEDRAAAVCLDEPTRGMDRKLKLALAGLLRGLDEAVLVATHDPEFAAAVAERVVLLADGRVLADGSAADVLSGGAYFATETARILGGAGRALLPEDGIALLRARGIAGVQA